MSTEATAQPVAAASSIEQPQQMAQPIQLVINLQLPNPGEGQQLTASDIQTQITQQLAALITTAPASVAPTAAVAPEAVTEVTATTTITTEITLEGATAEVPEAGTATCEGVEVKEQEEPERPAGDGPRKRAVIVGINYIGQDGELGGCINDAKAIKKLLMNVYGYTEENIRLLTDDKADALNRLPTFENITKGITWLLNQAKAGDKLFFHFSGHGSFEEDKDGDEVDGQDEVICPLDYVENGDISDDYLNHFLVRGVPEGCLLTAFFDSCFSGSVLDLPFTYRTDGKVVRQGLWTTAAKGLLSAGLSYMNGEKDEMYGALSGLGRKLLTTRHIEETNKYTKSSKADIIMISGCRDDQTSADAREENQSMGALTYAITKTLTANPNPTYQELLTSIREILNIRYTQVPQLSSSHEITFETVFSC